MSDTNSHAITITITSGEGDPFEVTATVVTVEYRQEPEPFGEDRRGLSAELKIALSGEHYCTYFLSRLVGEADWGIDAQFMANGMPVHSNGFGARYLRVKAIAPELGAVLDAEAHSREVVRAAIGGKLLTVDDIAEQDGPVPPSDGVDSDAWQTFCNQIP